MYNLALDQNFAPFLDEHFRWNKKSAADPHRGLASGNDNVPEDQRCYATQESVQLELTLGQQIFVLWYPEIPLLKPLSR